MFCAQFMIPIISKAGHMLGLIALTAAIFITATFTPQPESLWLDLNSASGIAPEVTFRFRENETTKHVSLANTYAHQSGYKVGVFLPRHTNFNEIFIDLGSEPDTWQIQRAYFRSHLSLFRFDSHEWDLANFEQHLLNKVRLPQFSRTSSIELKTEQAPFRLRLEYDPSTFTQTTSLWFKKITYILGMIGLFVLVRSGYLPSLFRSRRQDAQLIRHHFNYLREKHSAERIAGAVALLALMIYLSYEIILQPGLYNEDSMELTDLLQGRLNLLDPDTYFYYRGYPVLLTKWMVYFTSWLPLQWQPLLFALLGLSMMWLAMVTMVYSGIIRSPALLVLAPTLLFVGSFNVPAMYLSVTGVFFSSTALLVALSIRPTPKARSKYALYLFWLVILSWSGPYAPQVVPAAVILLLVMSTKRKDWMLFTLIVSALLYTASSASGMLQLENMFDVGIRTEFFQAFVSKVMLLGLGEKFNLSLGLSLILLFCGFLILHRKDKLFTKVSLVFLTSSTAALATYFISFKYHQYNGELISAHLVIPQFLWMCFLVMCLDRLILSLRTWWGSHSGLFSFAPSWRREWLSLGLVSVCTAVLFSMRSDSALPVDYIAPDDDLDLFLQAVNYSRNLDLQEDEFIQLWDTNSQAYVTSFRRGSRSAGAVSVDIHRFPQQFHNFVLPVDLEREGKSMLQFHFVGNDMWYSNSPNRALPAVHSAYHRTRLYDYFSHSDYWQLSE